MSDKLRFWESWSPYWSYIEDNYLDLDSIDRLASMINDPALVIGAGQGILVEALRNKGLTVDGIDAEPEMVAYAARRRNLDIILANGRKMPVDDNTYQTSVIATGVIDFLDDEEQIRSILNEAVRVTEDNGKVFIAFYRLQTQAEELMRYVGLLTDDSRWHIRGMFELFRLKPIDLVKAVAKEANVSFVSAFFKLLKLRMRMPRKENEAIKRWTEMWERIDNPRQLIASVPDSLPCRNEESIRTLFNNLDIPIKEMFQSTSCLTVQI
jgi:hypothetical protein